jgi:hypothetical protein
MLSRPDTHEPTSIVDGDVDPQASLQATRVTSAALVAVVMGCAIVQLFIGAVDTLTATRPHVGDNENGLFPPELTQTSATADHHQRVRGAVSIAAGTLLVGVVVCAWTYRRRFLLRGRNAALQAHAQRLALYGFAAAFLCVLAHETLGGVISYSFTVGFRKCLALLVLIGFCASLISLALARDLRLPVRRAILLYLIAVLGAAISAHALIFWLLRFAREVSWRLQAVV